MKIGITVDNSISKYFKYKFSILLAVAIFIVIFLDLEEWKTAATISMPLITAWGLIYNIENKHAESKQEKANAKEILARKVGVITLNLEKFLNTKGKFKVKNETSVKSWEKFSNRSYVDVFEKKEIESLDEFFSRVKEMDEQEWFNTKNNNFNPQNLNSIRETILLGEKILKEIFNDWDKLKLDKYEISQLEFDNIINLKDYESLEQRLLELNKQGKSIGLIKKINDYYFKIPEDNILLFIKFLLKKRDILNIPLSTLDRNGLLILRAMQNLISMFKDQPIKIFDTIKKCLSQEDVSLHFIISLVHVSAFEGILTDNQIEHIKDMIIDKIKRLSTNEKLLNYSHLYIVIEFWNTLGEDKEVIKTFLNNCLEDKNKLIKLIRGLSHNMNSIMTLNPDYTNTKFYPKIEIGSIERYIDSEFKEKLDKIEYSNEENKELFEKFKNIIMDINLQSEDDIKNRLYDEIKTIFFKMISLNNEIVMIEEGRKEGYEFNGTDDKISTGNICKIWEEFSNYLDETFEPEEIEQINRLLEIAKGMEDYSSNYLVNFSTPLQKRIEAKGLCREGVLLAKDILKDEDLDDYMFFGDY